MFGSLSELFGKNFFVGYVFPAALITVAVAHATDWYGLTHFFDTISDIAGANDAMLPIGSVAIFLAVVVLVAILLLATNYYLVRLLEGYGALNPANLMRWWQVYRFKRLERQIAARDDDRDQIWVKLTIELVRSFPEREDLILPTRFGNTMRAFERYPQVVYNIEPIETWARLEPLIPEVHRNFLDDSKAQLDFWVNAWFGGLCLLALHLALMNSFGGHQFLFPMLAAAFSLAMAIAARGAAEQYGMLVKGAFDLYRGDLIVKLGLVWPDKIERERELWLAICQTMLFRGRDTADRMSPFRDPKAPVAKAP